LCDRRAARSVVSARRRPGSHSRHEDFDQAGADISGTEFAGSDQAWLAYKLGWSEATWSEADGVWIFGRKWTNKITPRILFFPGKVKPWAVAPYRIYPFVTGNYRVKEAA
jgi:hypothetical protein